MKKKTLVLALVLALAMVGIVGGTLAWLTDTTDAVVNTFTASDIKIKLEETKSEFKMVPGFTIEKDPKVTVMTGSEKCYLFIELKKSANFDQFLKYEIADGWTALVDTDNDGVADDGVYYRVIDEDSEIGISYDILKNNCVSVLDTVTNAMMDDLKTGVKDKPTLTVQAYATQYMKSNTQAFEAKEAWEKISTDANN